MADSDRLLELIENCIVEHGGDLGGWTLRADETLKLFDGRVTLRAEVNELEPERAGLVHTHVFTTLHEHDDEVLDACVFGMGDDRETALGQAAGLWMTCVAGPIKSFLDNKPICMTCQVGVAGGDAADGYSQSDFGFSTGLRAFVGPSISRGIDDERVYAALDDAKPWFRFAAESAAPRRVHLAKATVLSKGKGGWHRELEIDGHDVSHHDPDWPAGVLGPDYGYATRFAVFEFPRNSAEIRQRAELERTIRHFADNYPKYESVDRLTDDMVRQGFDPDLVQETESISTIAFGRVFFEPQSIPYPSTIIRARRNGEIQTDIPLMSLPAYSRARAIAVQLRATMSPDDFQSLCLYTAESHGLLQAMEHEGDSFDFTKITMYPCVVPELGVSEPTMNAALALLHEMIERNRSLRTPAKKPWWKFW